MADGQQVELQVVSNLGEAATYQWKKDGIVQESITGPSLVIDDVSNGIAGSYQVDATFQSNTISSPESEFQIVSLNEIVDQFDSWTDRFFNFQEQEAPHLSDDLADPDLDGLSNLAEYFFGLHPRKSNPPPLIDIAAYDGASLSFTYPRTHLRPDVILRLEGSNSLRTWFSLSTSQMTVTPTSDDSELVTLEVDWPFDPAFPRFLRLAIEQAGQ